MNIGLVIGKKNSMGVPGKNLRPVLGRPAAEYAFIAGSHANIDQLYVSTDDPAIASIGARYGAKHIARPAALATPDALTEDALLHAWKHICEDIDAMSISTITLLFCNNPAINIDLLNEAIAFLNTSNEFDSCFSVAKYDMFSPARARRVDPDGEIRPFVDLSLMQNVSSIRDAQGSVFFCDLSIQVMKPACFENMDAGQLPFKWQGRRSKAIVTDFGFDIDSEWQFVVIEYWLRSHGFTEHDIPWRRQNATS
jgi:CMP-N-acetylneuraminic acid synthetase